MAGANETEVMRRFGREPLSAEPLRPGLVPGIGAVGAQKLLSKGVASAQQLMGRFLLFNCSVDRFMADLKDAGITLHWAQQIADALAAKAVGFCTDDAPEYPTSPTKGTDGRTTTVSESFARSPLPTTTLVPSQVPGLGKAGISCVRKAILKMAPTLHPATPSAVQLLGLFLSLGRVRESYLNFLVDECGCQLQHAERTVAALESKATQICDVPSTGELDGGRTPGTPAGKAKAVRLPPTPENPALAAADSADSSAAIDKDAGRARLALGWLLALGFACAVLAIYLKMAGFA